jgi:GntR family transcriptional regulator, arabinose operon transcriptional repressor
MPRQSNTGSPMHEQVREALERRITTGQYPPSKMLPSEQELCTEFSVSRVTVRQAMSALVHKGLVIRRQGRGSFVCEAGSTPGTTRNRAIHLILANASAALFPPPLIHGLEEACRESSHDLIVTFSRGSVDHERLLIEQALDRRIAGVVLIPVFGDNGDYPNCISYLKLVESGVPLLFVDRYVPQIPIGYVVADDTAGMCKLTDHVLDLGHKRVGYVDWDGEISSLAKRREGFRQALLKRRVALDDADVVLVKRRKGAGDFDVAHEAVTGLIASGWKPPSALVCANTFFAVGAYRALRAAGLRVPEDVAVVGFGDPPEALVLDKPLTVWRPALEQMGLEAGRKIVELGKNPQLSSTVKLVLPGELVVRASCGAANKNVSAA